jgi:hypothetical protein
MPARASAVLSAEMSKTWQTGGDLFMGGEVLAIVQNANTLNSTRANCKAGQVLKHRLDSHYG